ncbi:Gfo/Idh/MocA family oxidoreductase [Streptomyces sp. NBC_00873]|uniref:Gfo/Idh/MocA family protein n=1 Tax=unclassified Streptomyces TaxID=2593676 RepID=UPI00386422B6|nr:Gfo/Idh/MocA family oxidoreductase [Streptomyces sp. NBC_00873]WTA41650.1 Gfo/Idh/MocA family oxidoreductase [Streptomyces sp. NBC_00842]
MNSPRSRASLTPIVTLPDQEHRDASVAFAEAGYDILLEKPIATSPEDCDDIEAAASSNNVSVTVCHVLRYTSYTQKLRELLDSGAIGEIMQIEPVGHLHFVHSFVRGNWRRSATSHSLLLAKSCHGDRCGADPPGEPCSRPPDCSSVPLPAEGTARGGVPDGVCAHDRGFPLPPVAILPGHRPHRQQGLTGSSSQRGVKGLQEWTTSGSA